MKTEIIQISEKVQVDHTIQSAITFKKFIEFLEQSIESGSHLKVPYFKWILKKFGKLPELSGQIPLGEVARYEEILELVSTCLLPLASDENSLWALSNSLDPQIFYSTDGFYNLVKGLRKAVILNPATGEPDREIGKINQEILYGLVLEKLYQIPYLKKTEWVRKFEDPATGLDKYFKVHIDTRFVEVLPIGELPELDCSMIMPAPLWGEEFKKMQKLLPLDRFQAQGFSVLTLTDVTAEQAVEQIGKNIVTNTSGDIGPLFREITHSLQTIAGSRHYEFGIVPFLKINDRPALLYENFPYSIIIQACWQYDVSKKEFNTLRKNFTENPKPVFWSAGETNSDFPEIIANAFLRAGIHSYMLFPVYYNEQLTGLFEIGTREGQPMMGESQLVKLRPAFPLITQLIQNLLARFNANIENIIKEKFTSIQPAVQWKFNETAWHYLRDHVMEEKEDAVENIEFKDLYPLYGAVDIRNSTILRNEALAKDYTIQLNILTDTVSRLDCANDPQFTRILETAKNWQEIVRSPLTTPQELRLNEFFNLDVQGELEILIQACPEVKERVDPYFASIHEISGASFENRRQLEADIQRVNTAINDFYEKAGLALQEIYPCYFEKFRTDGVEYDIYVGQSIAPKKLFSRAYLEQMKRWQLESMIGVVRLVRDLTPEMNHIIQTTQLLFISPQTIDITFRKDERRFDVEGAYNIRYHIIKKRIDKATLLDLDERLTQPGKIALVYFSERDAQEFKDYIRELQARNELLNDLEELELEPLQGVNGLRALRVGVSEKNMEAGLYETRESVKMA